MKKDLNGYSADRLADFVLDCILSSETKLDIIDVHFITPRSKDGQDVINHSKFLNSEFPVTVLLPGWTWQGGDSSPTPRRRAGGQGSGWPRSRFTPMRGGPTGRA